MGDSFNPTLAIGFDIFEISVPHNNGTPLTVLGLLTALQKTQLADRMVIDGEIICTGADGVQYASSATLTDATPSDNFDTIASGDRKAMETIGWHTKTWLRLIGNVDCKAKVKLFYSTAK